MMIFPRGVASVMVFTLLGAAACAPSGEPEVVAIQYIRAVSSGDPDTAVTLLDTPVSYTHLTLPTILLV